MNDCEAAKRFIEEAQKCSQDEAGHLKRTQLLLGLGKLSMDLWHGIYEKADPELKQIMEDSNFQPCREPETNAGETHTPELHKGYRIDLIYESPTAKAKAESMIQDYRGLGYHQCRVLSPSEVKKLDPSLAGFCDTQSEINVVNKEPQWKKDAIAVYRPGGCIDTSVFLPKFYEYLRKQAGQYTNDKGKVKNCFRVKMNRELMHFSMDDDNSVESMIFSNPLNNHKWMKANKNKYRQSDYVLCPGEAVDTLSKLGLQQPAYARFAGASLRLKIEIPDDQWEKYAQFNHCMEVHKPGLVFAWQARASKTEKVVYFNVAGTKAFYADKKPHKDDDFAKNRNLLQLNVMNEVLPDLISIAMKRDTCGKNLNTADLQTLESQQIAIRWVGTRAVAYDGFTTSGPVCNSIGVVKNLEETTHLGSGGVSSGIGAVWLRRYILDKAKNSGSAQIIVDEKTDLLAEEVMQYSKSTRRAG